MTTALFHGGTKWSAQTERDEDLELGFGVVWTVFDENNVRVGGFVGNEEDALKVLRTRNHGEPLRITV